MDWEALARVAAIWLHLSHPDHALPPPQPPSTDCRDGCLGGDDPWTNALTRKPSMSNDDDVELPDDVRSDLDAYLHPDSSTLPATPLRTTPTEHHGTLTH
jgi:hypothetical protein